MKRRISTLVTSGVLALALVGVAVAGPFDDAVAAYQRGDYAAAMSSPPSPQLPPPSDEWYALDPMRNAGLGGAALSVAKLYQSPAPTSKREPL